jgi:hypothetical protein
MCGRNFRGRVIHIAHRDHVIDLRYSQPVKNVGHESLEPHVLNSRYQFSGLEVFVSRIAASLPQVVHQVPISHEASPHPLLKTWKNRMQERCADFVTSPKARPSFLK